LSINVPSTAQPKPSLGAIWKAGFLGAVIAAAINVILYLIGRALGAMPSDVVTPTGRPVEIVGVVLLSAFGVLAGTLVYTVLTRFLSVARANRWFVIIAIVVLVIMAASPFSLPGAPTIQIVLLEIMHLVAGLSAVYFLTRWKQ
jgi:hypothetical protein